MFDKREKAPSVLLLEDEPLIAMATQMMLEEIGITSVFAAQSCREALQLIEDMEFDFAILDLNLAGETSAPVAERLLSRGVAFAFASGVPPEGLPVSCADAPVIAKPFSVIDLARLVCFVTGDASSE